MIHFKKDSSWSKRAKTPEKKALLPFLALFNLFLPCRHISKILEIPKLASAKYESEFWKKYANFTRKFHKLVDIGKREDGNIDKDYFKVFFLFFFINNVLYYNVIKKKKNKVLEIFCEIMPSIFIAAHAIYFLKPEDTPIMIYISLIVSLLAFSK